MSNEQEQFLKELENNSDDQVDVMEQSLIPEEPEEGAGATGEAEPIDDDESGEDEESKKNRRHRRLEKKLQEEREANIALNERLKAISETQKFREEAEPAEYLEHIKRIYGDDSPEASEATRLLSQAFKGVEERATKRALEQFEQKEKERQEAIRAEEQSLNSMVSEVEEEFDIEMTPDMQKSFFKKLEKLSPKDSNGNIIQYADPYAVWEDLASAKQTKKPENPAKKLSSRSMVNSGPSKESNLQDDSATRFLRENGII